MQFITRPLGIIAAPATFIGNIVTKSTGDINHSVQGLFITDISDHFPVFDIPK